ncbi:hypothetical protein GCK72_006012 [Caenorhabditis remanei]|uniref:Uncharacterized protein n=1 Tax=Caenorhabditis remanei TaxID=31234 RepID=A0A6A5HH73_CAERE|nr:hypothetical protein GCK72_006012 [Caenorhabditis remanei]KAF1766056.1 hypothetical protein GCK72_006012 [Caenorhabditis remanei]
MQSDFSNDVQLEVMRPHEQVENENVKQNDHDDQVNHDDHEMAENDFSSKNSAQLSNFRFCCCCSIKKTEQLVYQNNPRRIFKNLSNLDTYRLRPPLPPPRPPLSSDGRSYLARVTRNSRPSTSLPSVRSNACSASRRLKHKFPD